MKSKHTATLKKLTDFNKGDYVNVSEGSSLFLGKITYVFRGNHIHAENVDIEILDPTYPKPSKIIVVQMSELIVPVKHEVTLHGNENLIVYLAPDDEKVMMRQIEFDESLQRVYVISEQRYSHVPKHTVKLIGQRRLASWPTDRRRCDSPVMLRLLEEIRAANRRYTRRRLKGPSYSAKISPALTGLVK